MTGVFEDTLAAAVTTASTGQIITVMKAAKREFFTTVTLTLGIDSTDDNDDLAVIYISKGILISTSK